jgi:hypothetical protein
MHWFQVARWKNLCGILLVWCKSKVHPKAGHYYREWKYRYSSTLSLTWALDGNGWLTPRTLYLRQREPVPIVQEAELDPGPVWTSVENLAPTGTRFPDGPACSESLYRLRYRGPLNLMEYNEEGSKRKTYCLKCEILLTSVLNLYCL